MSKELGKMKKYFMLFVMLVASISIIVYILKKIAEKRAAYLKELNRQERHAENAILEEQEAKIEEEEREEKTMVTDMKYYSAYQEFLPESLWDKYVIHQELFPQRPETETEIEVEPAQVEVLMYYQSFVKLFRVIIISVRNLNCFRSNDSKLIKLKVLLRRPDGTNEAELSETYSLTENVSMEERFSFQMQERNFSGCILYISVWSVDIFYKELLLGAISIDLSLYDHTLKRTIIENVIPVKQDKNIYGYLLVSLCRIPTVERLVCVIMSGKDLRDDVTNVSVLNNVINPFVKVSLLNDGKLIKKHKTEVAIETREPQFNEMIEFYVPDDQLKTADILLMVMHKHQNNSNNTIGTILLGNHGNGVFYEHWNDMLTNPDQSIAKWHPILR